MHKKKLLTRLVSGAVVVAVTAGSALLVNGVAGAVPPPGALGFNTLSPSEGFDTTPMFSTTSGPCPSNSSAADLTIVGPIGVPPATATFDVPFPATALDIGQFSNTEPFVQQFRKTVVDLALERGRPLQVGEYHLTTNCYDEFGFVVQGNAFTGGLIFDTTTTYTVIPPPTPTPAPPTPTPAPPTPTPAPPTPTVTPTPTPTPGAITTTTTLSVIQIDLPFGGGFALPIANVAPRNAAGTVQFKDGATNLGGPVRVIGGTAIGPFAFLPRGQHSITAVFTPSNQAAFKPSTSNTVRFRF